MATSLGQTLEQLAMGTRAPEQLQARRRRFVFMGGFPELLTAADRVRQDDQTLLLESQRVLRIDAVELVDDLTAAA